VFYTCEEEQQDNKPNISCIPAGRYVCARARYNKGGYETFEITGVPGRSKVLAHVGNTEEDTAGCILIGKGIGVLVRADEDSHKRVPKLAVTASVFGFREFMDEIGNVIHSFPLTIIDPQA
jgi:hypothetical protein